MTRSRVSISPILVEQTLNILRDSGSRNSEGIVLWLGRNEAGGAKIIECYVPEHQADYDYFHIPPRAMSALLDYLGRKDYFVVSQVHSHPKKAFHSLVDDKWAIIRHEGALSLVLPYFASSATVSRFLDEVALFRLNARNIWEEVDIVTRKETILILP